MVEAIFRKNSFQFCVLDTAFAGKLLEAAKSLYEFANKYRGKYTECVHNAAEFYRYYSTLF